MKYLWILVIALLLGFGFAVAPTYAQDEGACADAIDNDGDGFVNDGCPAVGEPEATAVPTDEPTAVPTDEPTTTEPATQEPTIAPTVAPEPTATAEPTPTPATVPPTGGPPNQDPTAPPSNPVFSEWLAQSGAIGVLVAFIVMIVAVFKISLSSNVKRGLALAIGLVVAVVYVATKDGLAVENMNDVWLTIMTVLGSSQIAYLLATSALQTYARERQQE